MDVCFVQCNLWKKAFLEQLWYGISDVEAAIYCSNLFNSDATVIILCKTIYCIQSVGVHLVMLLA